MARQKLGQHFLASNAWRNKIFNTLRVSENNVWVEIGAGHGELTELITRAGARVIAIETDPHLAESLRANAVAWGKVEVLERDVLTVDFSKLPVERFRVYGSLPYYITSPILRRAFMAADRIESIHVVVQLEVAVRIAAPPGRRDYGFLSALCQFYAKPEIVFKIPPGAFRPPPRVTSALVRMDMPGARATLDVGDETKFLDFVQLCFEQKRKTLHNNLRGTFSEQRLATAFDSCGIPPNARAEQLSLERFAAIYKTVCAK